MLHIISGFLVADFIGGLGHWFEDTYIHYCTKIPWLQGIARDNEMHHYFPRAILSYSYYENVQISILISIVLFLILFACCRKHVIRYYVFYMSLFVMASFTNLFHRFSHQRECETHSVILFLQKIGILCSHDHHRQHHISEVDQKYCTIFSISNYITDTFMVWRFLEKIIALFGVQPERKPVYNHYKKIQTEMHENAKKVCPTRPTAANVDMLFQELDKFVVC